MADASELSKSAKKRAAKKTRDETHTAEEAEAAVVAAAAAAAAAAPKAKGKAKAKAQAAAETPAPKAEAKAKGKAKAAAKPPVEEAAPLKPEETEIVNYVIDDGSGDTWETSTGASKKKDRRSKQAEGSPQGKHAGDNQNIVGFAPQSIYASAQGSGKGSGKGAAKGQSAGSQSAAADVARILAMKAPGAAASEEAPKEAAAPSHTATVHVPDDKIGIVIGPKGSKLKMIQEQCPGVTRIDTSGTIFTIMGTDTKDVAKAETAIKELVEKGFCSIAFENFSENIMNVHPSAFPDLIGKQGAIVRKIKEELNVEINFQDVPKGSNEQKKARITLAGSSQNVERAKDVINNIMMYKHDELTHPGEVHEELDIEPWSYRYLIGKAGSEMKHIQHNWKVRVDIPRENSVNEKVLIVGEAAQVERAKAYVDKLIWNAENQAKGRDKSDNSAEDPWGKEEEVEAWMKPYMYKR